MPRSLHQSTPTFHGDRVRLRYGHTGSSAHVGLTDDSISRPTADVAAVFLPGDLGDALREACQAFNTVMDRHEQKSARTAHSMEVV